MREFSLKTYMEWNDFVLYIFHLVIIWTECIVGIRLKGNLCLQPTIAIKFN